MPDTDRLARVQLALDDGAIEQPDVLAWFAEAKRLFAEAEERFESGRVLPALSSLAAVPPAPRSPMPRAGCICER